MKWNPNLNLDNTPHVHLLTFVLSICLDIDEGAHFMCFTLISIYLDEWKSFMKFGIKRLRGMTKLTLN
jgi:hypothetical protein